MEPPLHVRRHGNGTFLVRSQVQPDTHYLVDFTDPEFPEGRCCCADYDFRIEPKLRRHEPPAWGKKCKHISKVESTIQHAITLCEMIGVPSQQAILLLPIA